MQFPLANFIAFVCNHLRHLPHTEKIVVLKIYEWRILLQRTVSQACCCCCFLGLRLCEKHKQANVFSGLDFCKSFFQNRQWLRFQSKRAPNEHSNNSSNNSAANNSRNNCVKQSATFSKAGNKTETKPKNCLEVERELTHKQSHTHTHTQRSHSAKTCKNYFQTRLASPACERDAQSRQSERARGAVVGDEAAKSICKVRARQKSRAAKRDRNLQLTVARPSLSASVCTPYHPSLTHAKNQSISAKNCPEKTRTKKNFKRKTPRKAA